MLLGIDIFSSSQVSATLSFTQKYGHKNPTFCSATSVAMSLIGYEDAPVTYVRLYNWIQLFLLAFALIFLVPKYWWRSYRRIITDILKGKLH